MLPLPHRIYAIYSPNIILCWLTKPTHYTASDHWTWQSQHSALPQNSGPNNAITLHYLKLPNPHPRAPHCTSAHRTSTAQHSMEQQVTLPSPCLTLCYSRSPLQSKYLNATGEHSTLLYHYATKDREAILYHCNQQT